MFTSNQELGYPITTEIVDGLTIIDHSARFQVTNAIDEELTENSHSATFNYLPGSRREIEYTLGKSGVSFNVKIIDAHPQGNSETSVDLFWDARIAPHDLPGVILGMPEASGLYWEYVDYPDDWAIGDALFPELTTDVANKVRAKGGPIHRLNSGEMSLFGKDVNGTEGAGKPEVVAIYGLGSAGVKGFMAQLVNQTIHDSLVEHIPTIVAREMEAFS